MKKLAFIGALCLALASPLSAGSIAEKDGEFTFSGSYSTADEMENTSITGGVLFVFAGGHFELGPLFGYTKIETESFELDGMLTALRFVFNFTPKSRLSPFGFASYGLLDGELNETLDDEFQYGGGVRIFVGDNASINFEYARAEASGKSGFDDVTFDRASAGISLFF